MKSKVYFTSEITPQSVLNLYKRLGKKLPGNVAIKVHSGEPGNQNFLRPDFWKEVVNHVGGTVVECNTAYEGGRHDEKHHMVTLRNHGWLDYFPVDLLDAQGPDMVLEIPQGKQIQKNYVGKDMANYDSTLVLSHFKGHPMGGFGGALKQLSIGYASSHGKKYIHGAGDSEHPWDSTAEQFMQSMADAAKSVVDFFGGKAIYINVMKNLSVDCDCFSKPEDPCMKDIGVLISTDPVAIDQACVDLIYASKDPGRDHMVERIETRKGILLLENAEALGIGNRDYELFFEG